MLLNTSILGEMETPYMIKVNVLEDLLDRAVESIEKNTDRYIVYQSYFIRFFLEHEQEDVQSYMKQMTKYTLVLNSTTQEHSPMEEAHCISYIPSLYHIIAEPLSTYNSDGCRKKYSSSPSTYTSSCYILANKIT